jgi:hypothetical protein
MTVVSQMNPSEPALEVDEGLVSSEEWTEPISDVGGTDVEMFEDVTQSSEEAASEVATQVQESAESVQSVAEELTLAGQEAVPAGQ